MDLLDAGIEKPPRSTVERSDTEVQQLYAQWEALQVQDGVLYRNFIGIGGQVRCRQLLAPRSLRAPICGAYGRPHEGQKDTALGDEDCLLETLMGQGGAVL